MLATERRGELGIQRAIGTRRGHLVQTFTFEGAAVAAALAGALLGAAIAFLMVLVMAQAFDTAAGESLNIEFSVTPRSLARLRPGPPDPGGRGRIGLARQHDDDLGCHPDLRPSPPDGGAGSPWRPSASRSGS